MSASAASWRARSASYAHYALWGEPYRRSVPSTTTVQIPYEVQIPWFEYPIPTPPDIIIDHDRRVVIDNRPRPQAEPKLIVELSAEEKDVVIQCRCGDRISLVKLLGLEAVKPIFEGISARVRGLIEGMEIEKK